MAPDATALPTDGRTALSRRLAGALVVVVVVGMVVVLTLGFRRDPRDIRSAAVGRPAPAFELDRLDGQGRLRLEDYRGQVVVLNFWASWCIPCKQENPALVAMWGRYRSSDVTLIGIVYQDSVEVAREYTERMGNTWPSVIDADGRTAIAYGVFGIPETYFIRPDGVIAGRHVGRIDLATLITGVEAIREAR